MTILSKDTLALLRDEKVRESVEKVLKRETDEVTVTVSTGGSARSNHERDSKQEITLRRLST